MARRIFIECLARGVTPHTLTKDTLLFLPLVTAVKVARDAIGGRPVVLDYALPPLPELPRVQGAADCIAFADDGNDRRLDAIITLDFDGHGEAPHLGIPALLAARHFGLPASGITVTVVRLRPETEVQSFHHTPAALDQLAQTLQIAVAATEPEDAPRMAGAWCRCCAAVAHCPTRRQFLRPARRFKTGPWTRTP
jgi:hypothetical protein